MLLNDLHKTNNVIKNDCGDVSDFSKDFIDKFVDDFLNNDKQHSQIKYDCQILPYGQSLSGKELFKCPLCLTVRIEGRKSLTEHLHQHQKQYRPCHGKPLCCLCGKELSSNGSLKRHLLTHSNHRPSDCHLCEMKFTTNGNLNRHIKVSHGTNFTPKSGASDFCFPKPPLETVNTQQFPMPNTKLHKTSPSPNLNSSIMPNAPVVYYLFSLPNLGLPMNEVKSHLIKSIEDSINACKNTREPMSCLEEEILNLSTKPETKTSLKQENTNSKRNITIENLSPKSSISYKRIAKKISQKYQDRRTASKQMSPEKSKESFDSSLDLSINKLSSPMSELNSFLSGSSEILLPSIKSVDSCSDYDELSRFKKKKNAYKEAPTLIRCPMSGCTQKFPWNSALMRHIVTHTAHRPFQCIRCSNCFATKSNRERHMHVAHGIKVNGSRIKCELSPNENSSGSINHHNFQEFFKSSSNSEFLSEQEWIQMSSSDRKAEDICHSILKQAGDPVIEPNPHRQLFHIKTLLKI